MTTLKIPVTNKDHIQGNPQAIITLVEYGDYQCPVCKEAFPIVKTIQEHFGNKLRFVFRNFPLTEYHPYAEVAAETAEFAGSKNQFWKMHDLLYVHQENLGLPLLFELIKTLELDKEEFETALKNGIYKEKVKEDFLGGIKSGVNGTPTFFINGERHNGSFAFADLVRAIEKHL